MKVAWTSFFPIEWLPGVPEEVSCLPREHSAPWQRVLLEELEKVPSLRIHVVVLRKHFARDLTFERNGTVFHLIKTRGGLRAPTLFWQDTWLVRRVLREVQPDLVHAWGTERGSAIVASRLDYPYLVTIQGLMNWMAELMPLKPYERLIAWLERVSLARARLATAESRFSSSYAQRRYPNLSVRHIDVVPDRLFHHVERRPRLSPRRLLYVARLGPRKGGDTLLRALECLRKEMAFELVVVGDIEPAFRQEMEAVTSPELWRGIQFKNGLSAAEIAEELAQAALFVCPTRADTGPMAVKEAVMAGVPVVGSAIGGVVDYVQPGRNGFLCPPGDVAALVESLRAACRDPVLGRGAVEESSLNECRARMAPERMAANFLAAYKEVQAQGGGAASG